MGLSALVLPDRPAFSGFDLSHPACHTGLVGEPAPPFYRRRRPERTTFYRLFEAHFDRNLQVHEERFEPSSGPLQPGVQAAVQAFLACGRPEGGFARIRCPDCRAEQILAFSCRIRNFCPSCQAKRSAAFAEKLVERELPDVPHRHFVFTIPRALRGLFQRERRLLGLLGRSASDAVLRLYCLALGRSDLRPGGVLSLQTFGSFAANFHPHVHALISEGVYSSSGQFFPLPGIAIDAIEELFRHLLLTRLHRAERLSTSFLERLLAWRPSGFSVHAQQVVSDPLQLERLARYITRPSVRLDALEPVGHDRVRVRTPPVPSTSATALVLDVLDWIPAVVLQIPAPRAHLVRWFGAYSCHGRRIRSPASPTARARPPAAASHPSPSPRSASWARLLRRIFEVDPLLCRCGSTMVVAAVITDPPVVDRILRHLDALAASAGRGPPAAG